jgi:hypothetical protein
MMDMKMKALRDALGVVDAEIFLVNVKQERFDYTEWRQDNLWAGMTLEEILNRSANNDPIEKSFGLDG